MKPALTIQRESKMLLNLLAWHLILARQMKMVHELGGNFFEPYVESEKFWLLNSLRASVVRLLSWVKCIQILK